MKSENPLKRPLTFGDREQIEELRLRSMLDGFKAIPECSWCEGEGECGQCRRECLYCDGTGKDEKKYDEFKKLWPKFNMSMVR